MLSRKRRDLKLQDLFRTRSAAMRELLVTAGKVLERDVSVLILGQSGTGKDYLAEAIHACGPRRDEPFVPIDCASIPHDLFESELFGYEKGTFTDARDRKIGKLEAARGGTVYLDEIAALTPPLQAKLLRAIEERRYTRLGGHQTVTLSARVVSSSSTDLDALIAGGAFRRDLLYRINVVTLQLPLLRDRGDDLQRMAARFLRGLSGRRFRGFDDEALALMAAYPWPGNVRELRNVIERAALLEESDRITPASLPIDRFADGSTLLVSAARDRWTLEELEQRYIREILRQTRDNYSRAAEILGINRKTLLEKRKKYGLP
jgi:DNA-binding NtrC family response regulator